MCIKQLMSRGAMATPPSTGGAGGTATFGAGRASSFGFFAAGTGAIAVGIPPAAFQLKGTHGDQLADLPAALGANRDRCIGDTLLHFKYFLTSIAFILIHWHNTTSQRYLYSKGGRMSVAVNRGKNNDSRPPCQLLSLAHSWPLPHRDAKINTLACQQKNPLPRHTNTLF